jgi:hypothetical protein
MWAPIEFAQLAKAAADPMGSTFGCHKDTGKLRPAICRGYLVDQKRRDVPSIRLRLQMSNDPKLVAIFEALDEKDPDLYRSLAAMIRANRGKKFPARSPKAVALARKLLGRGGAK